MAEHLLVCGADPSAKDENGRTGMDLAVSNQRQDVEQRLRELVAGDGHRQLRAVIEPARYDVPVSAKLRSRTCSCLTVFSFPAQIQHAGHDVVTNYTKGTGQKLGQFYKRSILPGSQKVQGDVHRRVG